MQFTKNIVIVKYYRKITTQSTNIDNKKNTNFNS